MYNNEASTTTMVNVVTVGFTASEKHGNDSVGFGIAVDDSKRRMV